MVYEGGGYNVARVLIKSATECNNNASCVGGETKSPHINPPSQIPPDFNVTFLSVSPFRLYPCEVSVLLVPLLR
jgi:hypothetical protein